jgi:hypothetical protein
VDALACAARAQPLRIVMRTEKKKGAPSFVPMGL